MAPTGSGANPLLVACPLVGLVAAGLGVAFLRAGRRRAHGDAGRRRGRHRVGRRCGPSVLWMPVLPTDLPAGVDRAVTALALGLAAGAAAVIVWSGGLAVRRRPAEADDRGHDEACPVDPAPATEDPDPRG